MNLDDILTEAIKKKAKSNVAVIAFGRFNPITNGHERLVNRMMELAKQHKGDAILFTSISQDKKKNPLPWETKVKYLKKFFPKVQVYDVSGEQGVKSPLGALYRTKDAGYTKVYFVAGEDRSTIEGYIKNYEEALGFESIEFPLLDRPADAMSATKLRNAAKEGDFETFKSGMPSKATDTDARVLYAAVREGMAINESFEEQDLEESVDSAIQTVTKKFKQYKTNREIRQFNKKFPRPTLWDTLRKSYGTDAISNRDGGNVHV